MPPSVAASVAPSSFDARAGSSDCAVLDADALQKLRALDPSGANRVLERVLRAFESSLVRLLEQAARAREQGDHAAVRHVAHTLKSSSASVGALALSQRCFDIENRLRAQHAQGLDASLDGLQRDGAQALGAVRQLLGSQGSR